MLLSTKMDPRLSILSPLANAKLTYMRASCMRPNYFVRSGAKTKRTCCSNRRRS